MKRRCYVMSRNARQVIVAIVLLLWLQGSLSVVRSETSLNRCVAAIADRLELGQLDSGAWPGEEAYTGSLVTALAGGFDLMGTDTYRAAAVEGGNFILSSAAGNYYGDEAYALVYLSRLSDDPDETVWWAAAEDFYSNVKHLATGSTVGYVSQFHQAELSASVCLVAHHAVAAFEVDAEDKAIWREGLVHFLVLVDDDFAVFPVMALGAATWALASTGGLDDALLDPRGEGAGYWQGRTFAELPSMLLEHQVSEGDEVGSFYWRFSHTGELIGQPAAGYTEDTAFGALGLIAASGIQGDPAIEAGVGLARAALLAGCGEDGVVHRHLWSGGEQWHVYSASSLRALVASVNQADLNVDGCVDSQDLAVLAECWRSEEPLEGRPRDRVDIDGSGIVDMADLGILGGEWLRH